MAKKTYRFVVNDENVNEYGYRVLTNGIDTEQYMRNPVVLFMHKRKTYDPTGGEVIGKCINLTKEGTQLIAEIEFDEADEFAKKIAGKVERGFIRMASLSADPIATSTEPEDVLEGQKYETVTKCKMDEISIVDIGGNDNALRLSKNGKTVQLNKIESKNNTENMSIKKIALVMGQDENASESIVLKSVTDMKLAKEAAEQRATNAENKLQGIQDVEAENLVNKGIELGLFDKGLKTVQLAAFKADHEAQKVVLSKLISEKEKTVEIDEKGNVIKEITLNKGSKTITDTDPKETFDYLQKHDTVKLAKIRDEEPEKYAQISKAYGEGVRYEQK